MKMERTIGCEKDYNNFLKNYILRNYQPLKKI